MTGAHARMGGANHQPPKKPDPSSSGNAAAAARSTRARARQAHAQTSCVSYNTRGSGGKHGQRHTGHAPCGVAFSGRPAQRLTVALGLHQRARVRGAGGVNGGAICTTSCRRGQSGQLARRRTGRARGRHLNDARGERLSRQRYAGAVATNTAFASTAEVAVPAVLDVVVGAGNGMNKTTCDTTRVTHGTSQRRTRCR
jgi:hypothetical protein